MERTPPIVSVVTLAALLAAAAPAHALRVVTWNLLNYQTAGSNNVTQRQAAYRTVVAGFNADLLSVQELKDPAARDSFLTNVLNAVNPGEWSGSSAFNAGSGEYYAIFWKHAKVDVTNFTGIATAGPRDVQVSLAKPRLFRTNPGWFRFYNFHLKAGDAMADTTTRRLEATDIRNALNSVVLAGPGPNFVIGGDSNIYRPTEGAYLRFTESQADNDGRCKDRLNLPEAWTNNPTYAVHHTQSPCIQCPVYAVNPGFSGGGMDDRFDLLLTSYSLQDGGGMDVHSYLAYGQDGFHYNADINDPPTNGAVGQVIADALWAASDHLPVLLELRLPPDVETLAPVAFGDVLTGASAVQNLTVLNTAPAPADTLEFTVVAPAGFTAPGTTFTAVAGAAAGAAPITMLTGAPGDFSGSLAVATNAPDSAAISVGVSGRVLAHAEASLDSLAAVTTGLLDFGVQDPGGFATLDVRAHNLGYDALQARLNLTGAAISGGDGRFAIVAGTTPALLAGVGQTFTVAFDDAGATRDSLYEATLTIDSEDEPLPGAANAADLVVTLQAKLTADPTTSVGDEAPRAFAWFAPSPNPSRGVTTLGFDLPQRGEVDLSVFDLTGRRVMRLARGTLEAARHRLSWNLTDAAGRPLRAGLYFVRLSAAGHTRTARLAVVR